jgi:hypothetical protein
MGALLLLSVGLAGLLVVARGGARAEGSDVLGVIREKKLPALWGEEGISQWYIWTDPNGKPVGWSNRTRGPAGQDYQGKRLTFGRSLFSREVWQVDRAARTSKYLAHAWEFPPGARNAQLVLKSTTSIHLRDGQVKVVRTVPLASLMPGGVVPAPRDGRVKAGNKVPKVSLTAEGAAPADYVPEGLDELAFYLASLGERRATFTLLHNNTAIFRDRLHFSPITAVPDGPGKIILSTQLPHGEAKERMEFDSKGEVLRGGSPTGSSARGFSYERSTFDVVKKAFPDVEFFLRAEAAEAPQD